MTISIVWVEITGGGIPVFEGQIRLNGDESGSFIVTDTERVTIEGILKRGCGKKYQLTMTGPGTSDVIGPQPGLFDNAPPD